MIGPHMPPRFYDAIKIIQHEDANGFEASVNHLLKDGWHIRGEVKIEDGRYAVVLEKGFIVEAKP